MLSIGAWIASSFESIAKDITSLWTTGFAKTESKSYRLERVGRRAEGVQKWCRNRGPAWTGSGWKAVNV